MHIHSSLFIFLQENNHTLLKTLAKVQLPSTGSTISGKRCIQLQSMIEFEKIHSLFVR